jgi:hypothetical protein
MALCEECGLDHHPAPPEPVVIDPGPNDNSVEIARIEAATRLKQEKLFAEQERLRIESELTALRAENDALRNPVTSTVTVETEPDPEPKPVSVIEPVSEPEPPESTGPVTHEPKDKKRSGWFDAYK